MTDPDNKRLRAPGTSRHFLLSRADTRSLGEQPPATASEIEAAITDRFPSLKAGKAFIEAAADQAGSADRFAAMALRCDRSGERSDANARDWSPSDWLTVAESLESFDCRDNRAWGLVRHDTFGVCCPGEQAQTMLERARDLQRRLGRRLRKSVTVGVADYPCLSYSAEQIWENTLKALDHAAFFGPGSAVVFDAVSLNISGDRHYDRGEFDLAISEFERALQLDAANVNVYNSLGVCFGVLGKLSKAKAAFRSAIELDPGEYMAVYNLGQVNLLEGDRHLALEHFKKADSMQAGVFEIVFQTGKLYLEKGILEKSRAYLEQAATLNPDGSQVYRYLGECHSALGNSAEAVDAYQKAVRVNPSDATSLSALGCLLDERGDNPEIAMMFCRESVDLAPENALFRHRLGTLYLKHDRLQKALKEFRKAELLGRDSSVDIQAIKERMAAHR